MKNQFSLILLLALVALCFPTMAFCGDALPPPGISAPAPAAPVEAPAPAPVPSPAAIAIVPSETPREPETEAEPSPDPEPDPVEVDPNAWTGAGAYLLYFTAAGGKSHRNEPLPVGFDDLTEDRQAVWNRFAAALNG